MRRREAGVDTDRNVDGGSKFCQSVRREDWLGGAIEYWSGKGIMSLLLLRAKREPWSWGGAFGEKGSVSFGSPVVASAKRWNCETSENGSVGESHVCGRGRFDTLSRAVTVEGLRVPDSGKVRARGGVVSK